MKENKETLKGDFTCRCECCIHWRRHTHRVAANSDRRHGKTIKLLGKKVWYLECKVRGARYEVKNLKLQILEMTKKITKNRPDSFLERIARIVDW